MRKRTQFKGYRVGASDFQGSRLPALCVFFAFGTMLGHIMAHLLGGDSDLALLLQRIADIEEDNTMFPSTFAVIGTYFRFPLIVLLLGQCSFSTVAILLLMTAQGFVFSFSAATLVVSLGRRAILLALAAFGLQWMITLFVTLLLALWTLQRGAGRDEKGKELGSPVLLSFILLSAGVILEQTVVPTLFSLALTGLN